MSVSGKFMEVLKDTGKVSESFKGSRTFNPSKMDKRQIASTFGQESIPRVEWQSDSKLAVGRETPFDSSITTLETDYNTWLASLKSTVGDSDIAAVDKELQDLELKHTGFKGDELDTSFVNSLDPSLGGATSPANDLRIWTGHYITLPGRSGFGSFFERLFMASPQEQEQFSTSGLSGPTAHLSGPSIKAALLANPGVSGLTYEQAVSYTGGSGVPPGKKPSIAPDPYYIDEKVYSSYKEGLESKKKALLEAKLQGLVNPYSDQISSLLQSKTDVIPSVAQEALDQAWKEALKRVSGLQSLEKNPWGTRPPDVTSYVNWIASRYGAVGSLDSPSWRSAYAAEVESAKKAQELWDKGLVGAPEVPVLGQGKATYTPPRPREDIVAEVQRSLGWRGNSVLRSTQRIDWSLGYPQYYNVGYWGAPNTQEMALLNSKVDSIYNASVASSNVSRAAAEKVIADSTKAREAWIASGVKTGALWTPDQKKVTSYLKSNPDARFLASWDISKLKAELSKESVDSSLLGLYSKEGLGGTLGTLVRSREQNIKAFNERLKTLQDLEASYSSEVEKEKANRVSELESLRTSKSSWEKALERSVGYWKQIQGPSKGLSSELGSKLGIGSKTVGISPVLPTKVELEFSGVISSTNPYTKSMEDLAKQKAEWESKTSVNPYKESFTNVSTARSQFDSDFEKARQSIRTGGGYTGELKGPPSSIPGYPSISTTIEKAVEGLFATGYYYFLPNSLKIGIDESKMNVGDTDRNVVALRLVSFGKPLKGNFIISYESAMNNQDYSSWDIARDSLTKTAAQLGKYSSFWEEDRDLASGQFKTWEDSLKTRSAAYESQKELFSKLKPNPTSGLSLEGEGLTNSQNLILKAYSEGQRDLKSLSTYSGLKLSEVGKVLDDLGKLGRLDNLDSGSSTRSKAASLRASRVTTGDISNTSRGFWKRVTSI